MYSEHASFCTAVTYRIIVSKQFPPEPTPSLPQKSTSFLPFSNGRNTQPFSLHFSMVSIWKSMSPSKFDGRTSCGNTENQKAVASNCGLQGLQVVAGNRVPLSWKDTWGQCSSRGETLPWDLPNAFQIGISGSWSKTGSEASSL